MCQYLNVRFIWLCSYKMSQIRSASSKVSLCAEHDEGRLGPLGEALLGLHHVRGHRVIPVSFIIEENFQ